MRLKCSHTLLTLTYSLRRDHHFSSDWLIGSSCARYQALPGSWMLTLVPLKHIALNLNRHIMLHILEV